MITILIKTRRGDFSYADTVKPSHSHTLADTPWMSASGTAAPEMHLIVGQIIMRCLVVGPGQINVVDAGLPLQLLDGPELEPGAISALGGQMKNPNQFLYTGKVHVYLVSGPLQFKNCRFLPLG